MVPLKRLSPSLKLRRRLVGGKSNLAAISAPDFWIAHRNLVKSPLLPPISVIKKGTRRCSFLLVRFCFATIGLKMRKNIKNWDIK
jgi:hypothetical protein